MTGARSEPPVLSGFTFIRWLGGGGFADVFLYRQHKPEREVAIKVLRAAALDAEALRRFDDEANLMARVSTHPHIVSVYTADVAADGRPYLVMEYYPKPHFGERCRSGGLPIAEVLKVGVQVAGAVATAHAADILHRDIKPANILVSAYGFPGLTDFGIAGALGTAADGMTPQFTAPEILGETGVGDVASDVYSLAATVYALAAGRSPFEVPGGDNRSQALIRRVLNDAVPPTGRPDLPPSLEHLLAQALAKRPSQRPQAVAAFAAGLRDVELELRLVPTTFELGGHSVRLPAPAGTGPDDEDGTRHRVQVVRPALVPAPPTDTHNRTVTRNGGQPAVSSSPPAYQRQPHASEKPPAGTSEPPPAARRLPRRAERLGAVWRARRLVLTVGASAVVLSSAVAAVQVVNGGGAKPPTAPTSAQPSPPTVPPQPPTSVVVAAADGGYVVSFDTSAGRPGDRYEVRAVGSDQLLGEGSSSPIALHLDRPGRTPCLTVTAIRDSMAVVSDAVCPE
ncbi:MAG: protein kinase domain-containing protein [Nocardioidaceae bacterium]